MDWFSDLWSGVTDFFSGASDTVSTALSDVGTNISDLAESVSTAFSSSDWGVSDTGLSVLKADKPLSDAVTQGGGFFDKASAWVERNKKMSELIAGAIAAPLMAKQKSDLMKEQLSYQDQLAQENNQKFSMSVGNLKKPGLINSSKLTRVGGAPVFTNGLIGSRYGS
jgi:hypothetical protein